MASQPINLPSVSFKSKKDATDFFRKMLNCYQDGDELTPEDDTVLFELLQLHPEAFDKIGVGVKRFYRRRSPNHPTSCFHIERTDGSTTDFSYVSCISKKAPATEQQFYAACRYAVFLELTLQKKQLFNEAGGIMNCAKTGAKITIDEAEYRHTIPRFREIVAGFIAETNITISPALVTHSADMQYVAQFADRDMESAFKTYHAKHAKLVMYKKMSVDL